jgi:hypothetical protein
MTIGKTILGLEVIGGVLLGLPASEFSSDSSIALAGTDLIL